MTGFGKATKDIGTKKLTIQIKSLNSKQMDLSIRTHATFKDKEAEIRSMVLKSADRGKIELSIHSESASTDTNFELNQELFKSYYKDLKQVMVDLEEKADLMSIVSKFPEVLRAQKEELESEQWDEAKLLIEEALGKLNAFREQEGEVLKKDFISRIDLIAKLLKEIESFEKERIDRMRSRIEKNLSAFLENSQPNKDRFEQEMIYYLEKIDITEEKDASFGAL